MTTHEVARILLDNPERDLYVVNYYDNKVDYELCTGINFSGEHVSLDDVEYDHHIQTKTEHEEAKRIRNRPSPWERQGFLIRNITVPVGY